MVERSKHNMVTNILNKIMAVVLLAIIFPVLSQAQNNVEYHVLNKHRNWGIVAGPVLFDKATIAPQYGDYSFINNHSLGYNAGVEYNFYQNRKWSFTTGLITSVEPIYNVQFTIKKDDLYPGRVNDLTDRVKSYSLNSFSSPLLLKLNIQASNSIFINVTTGLKIMYFPDGSADMTITITNDVDEERQVFGLKMESPENIFQGSFVIGTGLSYALEKVLLKANFIYVMNFQNTISGEYQFANLFSSQNTRGYYDLSGNYLGLMFSVSLKKSKG